ncbi:MAG TPA: hypothetical protein VGC41_27315 [Kofleriaceae bacterium]
MRIITSALIAIGLTGSAGAAMADGYHRDHDRTVVVHERRGPVRENRVVVTHYRDYHSRPAMRYERHEYRHGYRWQEGNWYWQGGEWSWRPGIYIRL